MLQKQLDKARLDFDRFHYIITPPRTQQNFYFVAFVLFIGIQQNQSPQPPSGASLFGLVAQLVFIYAHTPFVALDILEV